MSPLNWLNKNFPLIVIFSENGFKGSSKNIKFLQNYRLKFKLDSYKNRCAQNWNFKAMEKYFLSFYIMVMKKTNWVQGISYHSLSYHRWARCQVRSCRPQCQTWRRAKTTSSVWFQSMRPAMGNPPQPQTLWNSSPEEVSVTVTKPLKLKSRRGECNSHQPSERQV